MARNFIFTSESVSEGHPDKMADQVSDAILDAILAQDPHARVACETLFKTGMAIIAGEITTTALPDYEQIIRQTINDIGYTGSEMGFDGHTCAVLTAIGVQSPDINQGVDRAKPEDQGAGDQGLMFGYATNETDVLMPAAIQFAHRLVERQAEVRKNGILPLLRPDAKSQVSLHYVDGKPVSIDAVVLSTQHAEEFAGDTLREAVMDEIIKPILDPTELLTAETKIHINPTGSFVIGGPMGDAGLTGRKIIVDTCRRSRRQVRDPGFLRDRRGRTDVNHDRHLWHRQYHRRTDHRAGARAFRSAAVRHSAHARPAECREDQVPQDRGLWPLRTRGRGLQLGRDG